MNPDEIINPADYIKKFLPFKRLSAFGITLIIIGFILITGSFYTIQPNEVGLVLRFGKFVRETNPGLHFKIPLNIEKVYPVKVKFIYKKEFGFRTKNAGVLTTYEQRSYAKESLMLTGDLNVLDVQWIIQYRVKNPFNVLFRIRNINKTLNDVSSYVMHKIVGDYSFNEVLGEKRIEINNVAQQLLQKVLNFYNAGIQIVTVQLQNVNPPDPVKPSFNGVNEAKQERDKLINQAWGAYNKKIPEAKGRAKQMIQMAQGYAIAKVNNAQGNAQRFILRLSAYQKAKAVTLQRLYLNDMSDILQNAGKKYIVDPEEKSIFPLLKLQ